MLNKSEAKIDALGTIADIVGLEYFRTHIEEACESYPTDDFDGVEWEYFLGFDADADTLGWKVFARVSVNRETKQVTVLDYRTPDGHRMENPILPVRSAYNRIKVKRTGYFCEMPDGRPSDPSIKDYIHKGADYLIEKICSYLDSGIPIVVSPGTVTDIIDESKGTAGSPSILTDGKWAWPGVLSYYVKNYNLLLDSDFIDTMISNGWRVPVGESDLDYSEIYLDGEKI